MGIVTLSVPLFGENFMLPSQVYRLFVKSETKKK